MRLNRVRLLALLRKESIQVLRDPSAWLIAFVLPLLLLFLFAYAVSLDIDDVPIGVVMENDGPAARDLAAAYRASAWLDVTLGNDRREFEPRLVDGTLNGIVVIPADLEQRLGYGSGANALQIITDGSQPNTATFTAAYANGVFNTWLDGALAERQLADAGGGSGDPQPAITLIERVWFNPELDSRRVLIPGAIAIVMTMIGTLLTALVVAREWERGTMEALLSTPASLAEILLTKLLPYFILGLATTSLCVALSLAVFEVPLRGSPLTLLLLSIAFLLPALGQGLLISIVAKNQFIAAQAALISGFLPAFLLSGFLFEIDSMPLAIRLLTYMVPARWYVDGLQSVFLVGDVPELLLRDIAAMCVIGAVFIALALRRSSRTLDS